jgi:hypothetical protein
MGLWGKNPKSQNPNRKQSGKSGKNARRKRGLTFISRVINTPRDTKGDGGIQPS